MREAHAIEAIQPLGDSALLVSFAARIDPDVNRCVHALRHWLLQNLAQDILETVPAYHSLAVYYSPFHTGFEKLSQAIRAADFSASLQQVAARTIELPVCYDPRVAPDIDWLAGQAKLSVDEVVALHSGAVYRVYFLGFKPGFAYLGGLHPRLHTPRKATPRLAVPAGSVGIGGAQTGIYPQSTPGGWQIIGRTPTPLFNPDQDPPCLLQPGDQLRFKPIGWDEFLLQGGEP
ncbi:MAG TPA: 5-oxoprolinase subunit PxpB [Arenimonas sp.]|nr:5-oxoprolinase subunit PxpB [Arenimonas sp.]